MAATPESGRPDWNGPTNPLGEALEWAARIMAVSIEMVLPGLGGEWLDRRLGTSFLVIAGFTFGILAGVSHLLLMTAGIKRRVRRRGGGERDET